MFNEDDKKIANPFESIPVFDEVTWN